MKRGIENISVGVRCPRCEQVHPQGLACQCQSQNLDEEADEPSIASLFPGVNMNAYDEDSLGLGAMMMQDPLTVAFSSMAEFGPFGSAFPKLGGHSRPGTFLPPPSTITMNPFSETGIPIGIGSLGINRPFSTPGAVRNFSSSSMAMSPTPKWKPNLANSFPVLPQAEFRTRDQFQNAVSEAFEEAYPCLKGLKQVTPDSGPMDEDESSSDTDEDDDDNDKAKPAPRKRRNSAHNNKSSSSVRSSRKSRSKKPARRTKAKSSDCRKSRTGGRKQNKSSSSVQSEKKSRPKKTARRTMAKSCNSGKSQRRSRRSRSRSRRGRSSHGKSTHNTRGRR